MARPAEPRFQQAARAITLENGLKVLIYEEHTVPLASVWCWYKVGSRDERLGRTGLSHWVEHMNFKGTEHIPPDRVKGFIEQMGGTWNGYTWIDQTAYFETAAREALDRMLFIEAERMGRCLYDPNACESERSVIISELEGGENDPDQLLDQEVTATAFRVHSYGHPTIGWLSDLQRMTREDLLDHYRHFYVPNNATLVVAGDVQTEEVVRRVEAQFGGIPSGSAPERLQPTEPDQLGERRVTIRKEGTTAYFRVAYHAPSARDPRFLPLLVLDAALTGAKGVNLWSSFRLPPPQRSTRLYRALVERGLASAISGALLPTDLPFLYTVSATATEGVPLSTVESAVLEELDRTQRDGITPAEVDKAKAQLRARFIFDNDSITSIAHQLGYFETIAAPDMYAGLERNVASVTPGDVAMAAHDLLRPPNRTIGWFDPTVRS